MARAHRTGADQAVHVRYPRFNRLAGGTSITWQGEWEGKQYEDKGEIIEVQPESLLEYTHNSPLSGQPDLPENYHTVSIGLASTPNGTKVTLTQDHNETEKAREDSEANWQTMLDALKKHVEVAG